MEKEIDIIEGNRVIEQLQKLLDYPVGKITDLDKDSILIIFSFYKNNDVYVKNDSYNMFLKSHVEGKTSDEKQDEYYKKKERLNHIWGIILMFIFVAINSIFFLLKNTLYSLIITWPIMIWSLFQYFTFREYLSQIVKLDVRKNNSSREYSALLQTIYHNIKQEDIRDILLPLMSPVGNPILDNGKTTEELEFQKNNNILLSKLITYWETNFPKLV